MMETRDVVGGVPQPKRGGKLQEIPFEKAQKTPESTFRGTEDASNFLKDTTFCSKNQYLRRKSKIFSKTLVTASISQSSPFSFSPAKYDPLVISGRSPPGIMT